MSDITHQRLSDLILVALERTLEQKDLAIAENLSQALMMSLTRNAGGKNFVERRTVDDRVVACLDALESLKKGA